MKVLPVTAPKNPEITKTSDHQQINNKFKWQFEFTEMSVPLNFTCYLFNV